MQITELKRALAPHAASLCQELYPSGKIENGHFKLGSLDGESGRSLSVILHGEKAGTWTDFATQDHGDLIDLVAKSQSMPIREAMDWASKRYGIKTIRQKISPAAKKKHNTPCPPNRTNTEKLHQFLESRGFQDVGELCHRHQIYATDTLHTNGMDLVFQFFDADGKLQFLKNKPIDYEGDPGQCGQKDLRSILYGWHTVPDHARTVWITEGELDAIAARELGFPALSLPSGVNGMNWIDHDYHNLERFDEILVATDQDEPGEKCAKKLMKRIGDRCMRIELPLKDIYDVLMKHGYAKAKTILDQAYDEAKWKDPSELYSASEFIEKVDAVFDSEDEAVTGFHYGFDKLDRHDLRIRPHELHGVAGYSGSGKSMWLGQVCLNLMAQGKKVCIASMEMEPEITLKRMVMQATGKGKPDLQFRRNVYDWWAQKLFLFHAGITPRPETLFKTFEYAYRRYGVTVFVIDSLTNLSSQQDFEKQQRVVETCVSLKRSLPVTVFLVAHVKKGENEYTMPNKMDVKGSGAITDLADVFLSVWKNKRKLEHIAECEQLGKQPDQEIMDHWDVVVSVLKNRHGMFEGKAGFEFETRSCQYLETRGVRPKPYVKAPIPKDHPLL